MSKKVGEKGWGGGGGGNRKKKKGRKKKGKRKKKGEVNKNKRKERVKEGGEEDRMKNRKEKELGSRIYKRKYYVGTEPNVLVYIGILVTSTTTGHDGSVVSALASQAKGRGSNPSCGARFLSPQVFSIFQPQSSK